MGAPDFEAWYRAEHPALLASLTLMSGEPDLAREVVDEALARALERWDRVSRMASPGGWAYRVAVNCLRRHKRRATLEDRLHQRQGPDEAVEPTSELWALVRDLPPRQRDVTILRYVADLSQADIAAVLRIKRSTVSSTLTQAHRALGEVERSEEVRCHD